MNCAPISGSRRHRANRHDQRRLPAKQFRLDHATRRVGGTHFSPDHNRRAAAHRRDRADCRLSALSYRRINRCGGVFHATTSREMRGTPLVWSLSLVSRPGGEGLFLLMLELSTC